MYEFVQVKVPGPEILPPSWLPPIFTVYADSLTMPYSRIRIVDRLIRTVPGESPTLMIPLLYS